MGPELTRRVESLSADRIPFVTAIVVRAQDPTSVRAGDTAIVLGDGSMEGFVGGACAESSVRLQALRVLETGEPLLLRIVPDEHDAVAATAEGALVVANPCLSGGALEIFLEPRLPAPRIAVVGETPIGQALASLGERLGFDVSLGTEAPAVVDDVALVVASHGRAEEDALAAALEAGVPYVGLVASRRRGAAVVETLRAHGVPEDRLSRMRTPAGLNIGAVTPEEIALSILAEIVAARRESPQIVPPAATSATDPVCGMTVAVTADTPRVEHDGREIYFCRDGCRTAFLEEPARYAVEGHDRQT
jgi:xanthine dehydrogenase accessory factor